MNINIEGKTYEDLIRDSDIEEERDSEKLIEFENRNTDF